MKKSSVIPAATHAMIQDPIPSYGNVKIGALLELAVERTPYLSLKRCWNEKKGDLEGVEWYRRIMTELGDKCMVDKLQLRLCRQLAEILLRGIMDRESCANYEYASRAIASKAKSLSFYTRSNRSYFAPRSRLEEIILLLMISEIIVSQNMRVSPAGQSERRLVWRMFVRHARLLSASLLSRSSHSSILNVETVDALRARLLYQSKKRGIKENDIIIGGFADVHLAGMNAEQLHAYEKIINGGYMEWDLYYYLAGRKDPPLDLRNCRVFAKMNDFANTRGSNTIDTFVSEPERCTLIS